MRARLVAYDVHGARRGVVPDGLSLTRYVKNGEVPTLQASYTALDGRTALLSGAVEVGFEYSGTSGNWVEPINGRYLVETVDFNRLDNGQLVQNYGFVGIVGSLKYADVGTSSLNKDGQRKFTTDTPGDIMATLINEAKAAGLLDLVGIDFDTDDTSFGNPWTKSITRTLEPNHDLLSLIISLYEGGLCDFWTEGRTLRMGNPVAFLDRDLTGGNNPVYLRDQALTGSPDTINYGDMLNKVRVIGDNGSRWTFTNTNSATPFGTRLQTVEASGVGDTATARTYADNLLEAGAYPVQSFTREYMVADDTPFAPDRNYRPGDWILADTNSARAAKMLVAATSLSVTPEGLRAFATLGTAKEALALRVTKRLKRVSGSDRKVIGDRSGGSGSSGSSLGNWGQEGQSTVEGDPFDTGVVGGPGIGDPAANRAAGIGNMIAWYRSADGSWPGRPNAIPPPDCVVQWIGVAPPPDIGGALAMNGDLYLQTDF